MALVVSGPRRAFDVKSDGMDPPAFLSVKMAG